MPPSGKKLYPKRVVWGISNCIFNFNFLALVVSEILGGPKFTLRGVHTLTPPSGDSFVR